MPRPTKPAIQTYPTPHRLTEAEAKHLRAILGLPAAAEGAMVEMVESALTSYFIWKSSAEVKPGNLRAGLKPIRDATLALARKIQRLDSVTRISFVAANCQSDFETFSKSFNRLSRSIKVKPGRKPDWPLARTVGSLCLTYHQLRNSNSKKGTDSLMDFVLEALQCGKIKHPDPDAGRLLKGLIRRWETKVP